MGAKRALIVDDSKSARLFLSRILEQHAMDVESVESAEAAIEYLGAHRPDVIFMDHQMPGMDGFQAVQVIKNNPVTATIPIMMYTSQEGELYLSQARALGAVGVLPKQIKQTDVSKVLYELHLLPDRRRKQESFKPVTLDALAEAVAVDQEIDTQTVAVDPAQAIIRATATHELGLREQFNDLRRSLVASIETQSEHIIADFHALFRDSPMGVGPEIPEQRPRPWQGAMLAIVFAIALTSTVLWWRESSLRRELTGQLAQAREAQRDSDRKLAVATDALKRATETSSETASEAQQVSAAVTAATATEKPRRADKPVVVPVPYGDDALGGPRLETLRQLFHRLIAQEFHGTVDIRSFAGRFCLVGNANDGYSVAPDELPYTRCDVVGNPHEDTQDGVSREPLGFANLIGELRSATSGTANVRVSSGDAQATLIPYPASNPGLTAGEWNRAAIANNRVEIRLR